MRSARRQARRLSAVVASCLPTLNHSTAYRPFASLTSNGVARPIGSSTRLHAAFSSAVRVDAASMLGTMSMMTRSANRRVSPIA